MLIILLISCGSNNAGPTPNVEMTAGENNPQKTLPGIFQTSKLNPLDTAHSYIEESCRYLRRKLDPLAAQPGTAVMIIMFHEIVRGPLESADDISIFEFDKLMAKLQEQGFTAINSKQFLAFMERNVNIPPRSVLIIQDGSYDAENFNKNFREYWDSWGWTVISGWTSDPDMLESKWNESIALEYEGWVDHQAHGVIPDTVLSDDTSKAVITRELEGSLTAFADRFGKTPYAIIWPGGGFGLRPVTAARQLGYQLGFTANSRGPVMYNWVPLADQIDPEHPSYIPEGPVNDPLMTLPRYSPDQVFDGINTVIGIGEEAAAYAQANKATELEYYESE
ncbi:MAG TPA: hypothetical protein VFI68_07355, partial [Anaerolineales bacterium]|nr:hypothetical protein [Anaerolineales bacterium]